MNDHTGASPPSICGFWVVAVSNSSKYWGVVTHSICCCSHSFSSSCRRILNYLFYRYCLFCKCRLLYSSIFSFYRSDYQYVFILHICFSWLLWVAPDIAYMQHSFHRWLTGILSPTILMVFSVAVLVASFVWVHFMSIVSASCYRSRICRICSSYAVIYFYVISSLWSLMNLSLPLSTMQNQILLW